jgi:hypothetical protein
MMVPVMVPAPELWDEAEMPVNSAHREKTTAKKLPQIQIEQDVCSLTWWLSSRFC